jgi:hypothetical protein
MNLLKAEVDVRPCIVTLFGTTRNALFHGFTREAHAIVEFEDGNCTTVDVFNIRFIDGKIKEYCFD